MTDTPKETKPDSGGDAIRRNWATVRARFGNAVDRLSAVLFEVDPVGLNFTVNTDEYDGEAMRILPELHTCRTVEDVQDVAHRVFCECFDESLAGSRDLYRRIAERTIAELPELFLGML